MKVEFSEQALADLRRIYPEEHKFIALQCAIVYALKDNKAEQKAMPVEAFPDKDLYDYPVDGSLVLYELQKEPRRIFVWSVHESSEE